MPIISLDFFSDNLEKKNLHKILNKKRKRLCIFNKTAYLSDCSNIRTSDLYKLRRLKYLVIDCLKFKRHPGHFNLETSIKISSYLKPKMTVLTNLHTELDYNFLKKNLPKNIIPAFDGMRLKI